MPLKEAAQLGAAVLALSAFAGTITVEARGRGAKRASVSEIIVHATGGPFCKGGNVVFSPPGNLATMKRFFEANGTVSIHYIVGRDGEIADSVPEDEVAIHAVNHNAQAIGIELINAGDGQEGYPEAQLQALASLIKGIQGRWRIPASEVKGHEDVDRSTFECGGRTARRKQDPGPKFPWDQFKKELLLAGAR